MSLILALQEHVNIENEIEKELQRAGDRGGIKGLLQVQAKPCGFSSFSCGSMRLSFMPPCMQQKHISSSSLHFVTLNLPFLGDNISQGAYMSL